MGSEVGSSIRGVTCHASGDLSSRQGGPRCHIPTPPADRPARDRGHPELLPSSAHELPEGLATRVEGHLARFAEHLREGLLAASVAVGIDVMDELMAAEVTEVAGPRGKHQRARTATRHGTEQGRVALGGRRLPIARPRVRTVDGTAEVPLASYGAFTSSDLLAEGIVARMLAGLSTRRYGAALEPVGRVSRHVRAGPAARRSRVVSWRPPRGASPSCCRVLSAGSASS